MSKMTSNLIISISTASLALLLISAQATNPGVRLRLTDTGLQYGEFNSLI